MRNTTKLGILTIVTSHSYSSLSVYRCKGILGLCAIEKNGKNIRDDLNGCSHCLFNDCIPNDYE